MASPTKMRNSSIKRGERVFRRPGAEEKSSCPDATFANIPLITELILRCFPARYDAVLGGVFGVLPGFLQQSKIL